jgi:hypothetical protein
MAKRPMISRGVFGKRKKPAEQNIEIGHKILG